MVALVALVVLVALVALFALVALPLALVALFAHFALVVLPQIALPVPALEIKLTTLEPALHPAGGDWEESKQNSALMLTSTKDSWVML